MMILITGAGGRLGQVLESGLQKRYPDRVIAATREEIDLTDPARVSLELERLDPPPTVVLNCAAAGPEEAEAAPQDHLAVNRDAVGHLARACRELRCRLIHFSTVGVFSGRSDAPYREDDAPDAGTTYGRIRRFGEQAVMEGNPDHVILRLSMMCGDGEPEDPVRNIREAIETGGSLSWDDRRVSPLFAEDLIAALPFLLECRWSGILNLANSGACWLSEFLTEVARRLGTPSAPPLVGGDGPGSFRVGQGPCAALDLRRYVSLCGRKPRRWEEALAAVLGGGRGA